MIRTTTFANIHNSETITLIPNNFSVLENANIFNLLLIMLNNISDITDYFSNEYSQEIINKCDKNSQNCLTFIIYYIYKYLWRTVGFNKITEKDL